VQLVEQDSPLYSGAAETFAFNLANQSALPCGSYFVISPSTIADAQTRKNLVALVLMAKASGSALRVGYDSNAITTPCDLGMTPVYFLSLQ